MEWTLEPKELGWYWVYDADWKGTEIWDELFVAQITHMGHRYHIIFNNDIFPIEDFPEFMFNGPIKQPHPLPNHPRFT